MNMLTSSYHVCWETHDWGYVQVLKSFINNNIITLFMSQVYLAKHRGSTNWGNRKSNQHKSNQIECWFLVRGENLSTLGRTSWSRVENQKTQPTYDVRSGNRSGTHWWKASALKLRKHCSQILPLR